MNAGMALRYCKRRTRIKNTCIKNGAKVRVCVAFYTCTIQRKVSPTFSELCMETPCCCPSVTQGMITGNPFQEAKILALKSEGNGASC